MSVPSYLTDIASWMRRPSLVLLWPGSIWYGSARFIANRNITNLMHCGIEKRQNRCIVGYILPSLQSHNASNLWYFAIHNKPYMTYDFYVLFWSADALFPLYVSNKIKPYQCMAVLSYFTDSQLPCLSRNTFRGTKIIPTHFFSKFLMGEDSKFFVPVKKSDWSRNCPPSAKLGHCLLFETWNTVF